MMKLSKERFKLAEKFIKEKARALERELFAYYFKGGSKQSVLSELAKYQNIDGGFGNSLESDSRLMQSSCFMTSVAFQIISGLKLSSDNEMVKGGIKYLVNNYNAQFKGWLPFPPEIDEVPRAIWWNYFDNKDNKYNPNPSAEIAGYLAAYSDLVPMSILSDAIYEALRYIDEHGDSLEMHEIFCYQRLAEFLSGDDKDRVMKILKQRISAVVELDSEKWSQYTAKPLSFVHNKHDGMVLGITEEHIDRNLDFIIEQQSEDGSWVPAWQWGRFEQQWESAKQEWQGCITLENLLLLKSFNRIEE